MRIVVCGNQQSATDAVYKAYVVNHLEIFSNGSHKYLLWWIPAVRALQIRDIFDQIYTKIKKVWSVSLWYRDMLLMFIFIRLADWKEKTTYYSTTYFEFDCLCTELQLNFVTVPTVM